MKVFASSAGLIVRLDPGEEILSTLTALVLQEKIEGAVISGIGAVKNTVVGYFNLHTREYQQVELPEDLELVSFMGNLTWTGGEPFIHAHVTLSDSGCSARGGHLFSSEIAVTGEFVIQPTGLRLEREHDPRTGLNLISNGGS